MELKNRSSAIRRLKKFTPKQLKNVLPKNLLSVNNSLMNITKRRKNNALQMVAAKINVKKRHRLTKRQCWKSVNAVQRPEPNTQKI
jgi:hypothetical protein